MADVFDMNQPIRYGPADSTESFLGLSGCAIRITEEWRAKQKEIKEIEQDVAPPSVWTHRFNAERTKEHKLERAKVIFPLIGILLYITVCVFVSLFVDSFFWGHCIIVPLLPLAFLFGVSVAKFIDDFRHKQSKFMRFIDGCIMLVGTVAILFGIQGNWISGTRFMILFGSAVALAVLCCLIIFLAPARWIKKHTGLYKKSPKFQKKYQKATELDEAEEARRLEAWQKQKEKDRKQLPRLKAEKEDLYQKKTRLQPLYEAWCAELQKIKNDDSAAGKAVLEGLTKANGKAFTDFELFLQVIVNTQSGMDDDAIDTASSFIIKCDILWNAFIIGICSEAEKDVKRKMGYS